MIKHIEASLTHGIDNEPLTIIQSTLGEGLQMKPQEIRSLALALLNLADQCERRKYDSKQLRVKRVIIPI